MPASSSRTLLAAGAVAAGFVLWSAVFLGGSAGVRTLLPEVHDDSGATRDTAALLCHLLASAIASLLAGFLTARLRARWAPIGPVKTRGSVWALALLLLAVGIPVQVSAWQSLPVWYHLTFLGLLVPLTVLGGRIGRR